MRALEATVIVPTMSPVRVASLLRTLDHDDSGTEVIVVDNRELAQAQLDPIPDGPPVRVLRPGRNLGYSAAVNLAAREASGSALVLLNDDCTVDEGYVESLTAVLEPSAGITMAAGVMRQVRHPDLIDSAGMELDRTLLVFDYLHDQPISQLDRPVEDPIGPSGAAAAFDRQSFLDSGGFDEALFAYWEDVDLVLRLRARGQSCRLAPDARGTHEHSMTLGSGSREKNRLMGFGRGYVLRKWSVLARGRLSAVAARDIPLCLGQLVVDRNFTGASGRIEGFRAATPDHPYPDYLSQSTSLTNELGRRLRRRRRVKSGSA